MNWQVLGEALNVGLLVGCGGLALFIMVQTDRINQRLLSQLDNEDIRSGGNGRLTDAEWATLMREEEDCENGHA